MGGLNLHYSNGTAPNLTNRNNNINNINLNNINNNKTPSPPRDPIPTRISNWQTPQKHLFSSTYPFSSTYNNNNNNINIVQKDATVIKTRPNIYYDDGINNNLINNNNNLINNNNNHFVSTPPPADLPPPSSVNVRWTKSLPQEQNLNNINNTNNTTFNDTFNTNINTNINNNINNNNNTNLPPLPPYPNEEDHVIPEELHDKLLLLNQYDNYGERKDGPVINWETNPSSQFIYSLLLDRGMMLPYHSNLLDYHMSGPFLEYISILMRGNYFVRYKRQNSAPKERFFRIIMDIDDNINNNINNNIIHNLDNNIMVNNNNINNNNNVIHSNKIKIPHLVWVLHEDSCQIIDKVKLKNLIAVEPSYKSEAFKRSIVSNNTIKGCYSGQHRGRLPLNGCFSLWFWDENQKRPRSIDILTIDPVIYTVWVKTFMGFLSINSVSINNNFNVNIGNLGDVGYCSDDGRD